MSDVKEAIEALRPFTSKVPDKALDIIRDNWAEAEPVFLAELDWQIQHPLEDERSALFLYGLYLCAEMRCETAFERYVALLQLPEVLLDALLGDILTEHMSEMLSRTCGNRFDVLKELVDDEILYDSARTTALYALLTLVADGKFSQDDLSAYCLYLMREKLQGTDSSMWDATIGVVEALHFAEALPDAETAYEKGYANSWYESLEDVQDMLLQEKTQEETQRELRRDFLRFSTTEEAMSFFVKQWDGDDDDDPVCSDEELLTPPRMDRRRVRNALNRGVGRNDPCPCGSGKKYKKCCIDSGVVFDDPEAREVPEPVSAADEWMVAGYYYLGKHNEHLALICWRNCWGLVRDTLLITSKTPHDEEWKTFFADGDEMFCDWLEDYLNLLESCSSHKFSTLREGVRVCDEILVRFPGMNVDMFFSFMEIKGELLVSCGRDRAAECLFKNMVQQHPERAHPYVVLAELYCDTSKRLRDFQQAEQVLRQALVFAKDCADWLVEERLEEVVDMLKEKGTLGVAPDSKSKYYKFD